MPTPIGERVGCVLSANDDQILVLGYGVRIEDEVPPVNAAGFGSFLHETNLPNPCLLLDDGSKVYGCECWWGPEEKIRAMYGDREIIDVDINEYRESE